MFLQRFSVLPLKLRPLTRLCAAMMLAGSLSGTALALTNVPQPRVKPAVSNTSEILNFADAKAFRLGMRAADRRSWGEVRRLEATISDRTAQNVLKWRRALRDGSTPIDELISVIKLTPDWPSMTTIKAKTERLMFDKPLRASETIDHFSSHDPVTGEGRAALARAHYALGNDTSGDQWLKFAWRESMLTRDRQRKLFSDYKARLTQEDHAARADYLIWLGTRHYSSAEALLSLMSAADRKLMTARIRVGANRSGMDSSIKALSSTQAEDTSILFERAYWRRKRKSKDYALPVYLDMTAPASTEPGKKRLWYEKKLMSYWLLEDKKYQQAYDMVQNHGYERGAEFAEAEFIAGWVALTYLDKPSAAAKHFETLHGGVGLPVSIARASYWRGRAAQRLGDPNATAYFSDAAQYMNTYYGQLALDALSPGNSYINLPAEADTTALRPEFDNREIIKALRLIGEVQNETEFRRFAFHIDDIVTDVRELSMLGAISREYQLMSPSVRAGKQAGRFKAILTETSYPVPDVINNLGPDFDIPFVLAIARQESEFATSAVSSAKAYGMMQMIDSTAKATARIHKLKYNRTWLTTNRDYAAKLGAHHLNDLLKQFDGSYIMAAAAYNAGASRVIRWNKLYGDPRKGQIDPVNWVENIPFSETRNYVQRVMENMQVYEARLNGGQAELHINDDLKNGAFR